MMMFESQILDGLLLELPNIGYLQLGRGAMHPTNPNPNAGIAMNDFLRRFPIPRRDLGFIEFWQKYAGASFESFSGRHFIAIYGFDQVSMLIEEFADAWEVIENGVLYFADVLDTTNSRQIFFGFEATAQRPWGIYRVWHTDEQTHTSWCCETFSDWLRWVVKNDGHWMESIS
jgi:hypothetical protein